ncbi:MAG TPA: peptidylprolyl isomerase [Rhodopila sp.]|nr:peptidylprolyl isomerase [Rhodopila sp.]
MFLTVLLPRHWWFVLAAALALLSSTPVFAGDPAPATSSGGLAPPTAESQVALAKALAELDRAPDTIVAEVGSRSVTWGDIADAIRAMPPIMAALPIQQLYDTVVGQLVADAALAERAEASGLLKIHVIQRRMKVAADRALGEDYVRRALAPNFTDAALRSLYDHVVVGKPGPEEVRPRVIAVDTREQATALIQRLQKGESFSALARAFSKDGTAPSGGDLGFVRAEMMEPVLASVMFSLGVGQMTAYPVRSGPHWFIIKVEARRELPTPRFEEVRTDLMQEITNIGTGEVRKQALKSVPIEFYGMAGKRAKPAAK